MYKRQQQASLQPLLESVVEQYAAKASGKGLSIYLYDTDISATFDFKWTAEALANIEMCIRDSMAGGCRYGSSGYHAAGKRRVCIDGGF